MGRYDPPPPAIPHFVADRVPKDRAWAVLFALMWAAALALGAYGVAHTNPAAFTTDYSDPASCPVAPGRGRSLSERLTAKGADWSPAEFFHLAGRWLAASALAALALGWAFLALFRHNSGLMTQATIWSQVLIPAVLGAVLLVGGSLGGGLLCFGMAALAAFCFYLWRDQIALATRLLGVSAHALTANSGVITTAILLNLASFLALIPLWVLTVFALMNGEVVPNPARQGSAQCVDAQGQQVLCCTWAPNGFAQGYAALSMVATLWTMLLANQIRVFVTSGAVAQWYFAPAGLAQPAKGTMLRSLRHALGPSFGSLCLSSLVLTIAQIMRDAIERAQRRNGQEELNLATIITACLLCVAQCFWAIIEYLTKFATVLMAITGDSFLAAGRAVTDLLARNFLDAFASTIWFTPLVIQTACFLLAVGWAALSGGAYYALHRGNQLEATPGVNAAVLGASVYIVSQFVLSFLGGVLLSCLDAVFICWALDRDSQTVSHPEVYAVFQTVPLPGAVVEQPDGDIMYGAGQQRPETEPLAAQYRPPNVAHV